MIKIEKLASQIHSGDWHDKPLRWKVSGPAYEQQLFSTRADARRYARIRRKADSFNAACNAFCREA